MRRIFLLFLFRFNWREICFHIYSYFPPLWSLTEVKLIYFRGGVTLRYHISKNLCYGESTVASRKFFLPVEGKGEGGRAHRQFFALLCGFSVPLVYCIGDRRNRWGAKGEGLAPTFFFWQI